MERTPPLQLRKLALTLDAFRTPLVAWGARSALFGDLVRTKGTRLSALCLGHAFVALSLVLLCPTLLLVVGPLILGVPHVASDVRYLVLRYGTQPSWRLSVLFFCGALFALRVVETGFLTNPWFARVEVVLLTLWVLVAIVSAPKPEGGRLTRNVATASVAALALGALCLVDPTRFRMIFAHAHNVVGIGLWYVMYARRAPMNPTPLLAIAGAALLLVLFGGHARIAYPEWWGMHVEAARAWLAPDLSDPHATGLVLSYAFLQSVHYAVWLIFIPQAAASGPGTPTFANSLKSLWRDFGPLPLLLIGVTLVLVVGFAFIDPLQTQAVYLFVTPFHGYLEVAVLAYWYMSGRTRRDRDVTNLSTLLRR